MRSLLVMRLNACLTVILALALVLSSKPALSEPRARLVESIQTPHFRLYVQSDPDESPFIDASDLASMSLTFLNRTLDELARVFKVQPTKQVELRIVPASEYRRLTGSPSWTSAMYIDGVITIPLPNGRRLSAAQLHKTIRHEYLHAYIDELSGGNCPAWMDEGLAQLLEGSPNRVLGPALRRWIKHSDALPLAWLHNGFTNLDEAVVPAAYAQSLFATRTLINSHGFVAIRNYLEYLKEGNNQEKAFQLAFAQEQRDFELNLTEQIRRWAKSENYHP